MKTPYRFPLQETTKSIADTALPGPVLPYKATRFHTSLLLFIHTRKRLITQKKPVTLTCKHSHQLLKSNTGCFREGALLSLLNLPRTPSGPVRPGFSTSAMPLEYKDSHGPLVVDIIMYSTSVCDESVFLCFFVCGMIR